MDKINLPQEVNYAELYFTLKCNFKCDYCINKYSAGLKRHREELPAEQIAAGLNKIDFKDLPLTIGGGEPTTRKDFYQFLDLLRKDIKVDLLTNLNFNVSEFVRNVDPQRFFREQPYYKSIRVSYHPSQMSSSVLVNKVEYLQSCGFPIGIFGINHPLSLVDNIKLAEEARSRRVYFFIKDFLGSYNEQLFGFYKYKEGLSGNKSTVKCKTHELLVGPDGSIYKCHRDLYALEYPVASLLDDNTTVEFIDRDCNQFGCCNPCDLKQKTNKFFDLGSCSVEITEQP